MRQILITLLLLLGALNTNAQFRTAQSDSARQAEYREKIGLDMSVPDFDTKKIDARVMGTRLAGILNYLMENYDQGVLERQLATILSDQVEALDNIYFNIKKVKFLNAKKAGDEITILLKIWPDKNAANVKQADLMFHLINGVSKDQKTNDLFSNISHYVQAREMLNK